MKLIVNHRGQQSLVVSKPDVAVLQKAHGLINLAATFFGLSNESRAEINGLIIDTVALGVKAVQGEQQMELFDKNAVDDEDDQPPA